eukprot:TRINITY_DN2748_c0_g1_i1.p2 TRINITY_DN2748_c0_g1~~TRINITY_DN2748_c0_g1_i1.p2  ORF type:complete len:105 (-),score=13.34 TRINITY_DN2748_c0_g1_i1:461-775(-)
MVYGQMIQQPPPTKIPFTLYLKVAIPCFMLGAGMEMFMIHSGFYDYVTNIEAERLENRKEELELYYTDLKRQFVQMAQMKKIQVPEEYKEDVERINKDIKLSDV